MLRHFEQTTSPLEHSESLLDFPADLSTSATEAPSRADKVFLIDHERTLGVKHLRLFFESWTSWHFSQWEWVALYRALVELFLSLLSV
jgi:hypothetical protein